MKKLICAALSLLICFASMTGCSRTIVRYDFTGETYTSVSLFQLMDFLYITFHYDHNTYEMYGRTTTDNIINQTGTFMVLEDYIFITNDENPSADYFVYDGELAYFKDGTLCIEVAVAGYNRLEFTPNSNPFTFNI